MRVLGDIFLSHSLSFLFLFLLACFPPFCPSVFSLFLFPFFASLLSPPPFSGSPSPSQPLHQVLFLVLCFCQSDGPSGEETQSRSLFSPLLHRRPTQTAVLRRLNCLRALPPGYSPPPSPAGHRPLWVAWNLLHQATMKPPGTGPGPLPKARAEAISYF